MRFGRLVAFGLLSISAQAQPPGEWTLAGNRHFEVYSQGGADSAQSALLCLEQLRAFFFGQTGLQRESGLPARVIGFRSAQEYLPFRLRPVSDAYYAGTETRDYIVVPSLAADHFRLAGHEYVHLVLHASGVELPAWLNEGLAEAFSTVRVTARGTFVGGEVAAHRQALRSRAWIPMANLLGATAQTHRRIGDLFYAQSWALTHMLVFSPDYGSRIQEVVAALLKGVPAAEALPKVYGRPLDAIARDVRTWVAGRAFTPVALPAIDTQPDAFTVTSVPPFEVQLVLGDLLAAAGELERAESLLRGLARQAPGSAAVSAALGVVALRRGDFAQARQHLAAAIDRGITDPGVCYRYAILADAAGLPETAVRPALERAVALKPDYEDALYKLALLENNAGQPDAALGHLRAMRRVQPARAHHYWSVVADTLNQLGSREEAEAAARRAAENAVSPDERAHAAQLAYIARTEMAVQFTRDSQGRPQLATTRVPRDTVDWNPFIEPGDHIRRVEARLRNIECGEVTMFSVEAPEGILRLAIPDPKLVRMRNAPEEFTCGPQPSNSVSIVYAASDKRDAGVAGVVRGIDFE